MSDEFQLSSQTAFLQHAKCQLFSLCSMLQSGQNTFTCYTDHHVLHAHACWTHCQQHWYLCRCHHAMSSQFPVLLPQVMRSKLASQTQPLLAVSLTSRGGMLMRCQGMFAASLRQVHAATRELHNLQRFMRFHATREDVMWAAASEMQPCTTICNVNLTCIDLHDALSRHV